MNECFVQCRHLVNEIKVWTRTFEIVGEVNHLAQDTRQNLKGQKDESQGHKQKQPRSTNCKWPLRRQFDCISWFSRRRCCCCCCCCAYGSTHCDASLQPTSSYRSSWRQTQMSFDGQRAHPQVDRVASSRSLGAPLQHLIAPSVAREKTAAILMRAAPASWDRRAEPLSSVRVRVYWTSG